MGISGSFLLGGGGPSCIQPKSFLLQFRFQLDKTSNPTVEASAPFQGT